MKFQLGNRIISSFMLTVDNAILRYGEAYTNASGVLYPVSGYTYGMYAFTTPYRQLVHDASITGANLMTGVYVSGLFLQPGQSGLLSLNIQEGTAYFSWRPTAVSGIFSVKDISVYLSNEPEEKLLFETKMSLRPKYPQSSTGLFPGHQTYPVIFVKLLHTENEPLCLGGVDNKISQVRAVVLAESQFQLMAACYILESLAHKTIPIINVTGLPFDAIGGYTGTNYNYQTATGASQEYSYIASAKTSMLANVQQLNQLNPSIFPAFVDFEIWTIVGPA